MIRCSVLVKQLDCFLGLPSLLWDGDTARRKMYGAAGAFRPKPYGVEYRVLSNAWLLSEERMRFVYNQTVSAVDNLIEGNRPFERMGHFTQVINRSDTGRAARNIQNYLPNGYDIFEKALALGVKGI
jgi:hypothetical protein